MNTERRIRRYVTPKKRTRFRPMSKRRRGYPSETAVGRGTRIVHGDKELLEKLGDYDPCPCGSGRRFQALLPQFRRL
ncbi:MAG TPA: SEC-C metal-binding domain-containing protein [Armatimonadota bacterium]